ncbi:MAG: dihydrofolate reductase family protein [Candidatus Kapaibacteriota bacterium]
MRTLKLQVQITIDGFIAGAKGEMDWMTFNWDDALKTYVAGVTEAVDTIVLGRTLAQGFIPHWARVAANPDDPEILAGKKFTETPKVVFSKMLQTCEWENTTLANGEMTDEIKRLKAQSGGDIIAYGGSHFVSNLIKHNLIDEYHLFVNPTAIGCGMPIFTGLEANLNLKLVKATAFDCGIVVLCYKPC